MFSFGRCAVPLLFCDDALDVFEILSHPLLNSIIYIHFPFWCLNNCLLKCLSIAIHHCINGIVVV